MATKHLYECEDVAATLLYAIAKGNPILAVRSAKELYDSDEEELLHKILTLAWLLDTPDHPYEQQRLRAVCEQNTEQLLYLLAESKGMEAPALPEKSDALPPPPSSSSPSTQSQWLKIPNGWTAAQAASAFRSIQYALCKNYWQHAAYIASPLLYGENTLAVSSLLQALGVVKPLIDMLETTVFCPLSERILAHSLASRIIETRECGEYIPEKRLQSIWRAKSAGGRAGRVLTIPSEALAMWRIRQKPASRLMGQPLLVAEEGASAYWQTAVQEFDICIDRASLSLVFKDDEDQEEFYETYFPEDIPDEWSLEERNKSHDIPLLSMLSSMSSLSLETDSLLSWHPWQTAFLLCWS